MESSAGHFQLMFETADVHVDFKAYNVFHRLMLVLHMPHDVPLMKQGKG